MKMRESLNKTCQRLKLASIFRKQMFLGRRWSQALRVPRAIIDEHGGQPTRPLDVAHAMEMQPGSGPFRQLCGAAIAYGLTEGGCNADVISVTDLGRRVASKPIDDSDGLASRREAILRPRITRAFLQKYDGSKMPREDVALKVLESLEVPSESVGRVWTLVNEAARYARFLREINGVPYVDLKSTAVPSGPTEGQVPTTQVEDAARAVIDEKPPMEARSPSAQMAKANSGDDPEKSEYSSLMAKTVSSSRRSRSCLSSVSLSRLFLLNGSRYRNQSLTR